MARIIGPKCRICRRLGVKLFLKGIRCETSKCALDRREKPPGQHGDKRSRMTDYGLHLRETQRAKKQYGMLTRQFKRFFAEAARVRFRPVIMTSMAFFFGVLPLAIATGAGAGAMNAIGTAVTGGMLSATFIDLFYIPLLFVVVSRLFGGKQPQTIGGQHPGALGSQHPQ
jgi:hypothetical protein